MSAYTEQEELDRFKELWKAYGASLVFGVVLGIGLLTGYKYWTTQQNLSREQASALYTQFHEELSINGPKTNELGENLLQGYARTPYAAMTALVLASRAYDSGDKDNAKKKLRWAIDNAKSDAVVLTAKIRLAHILLESGDVNAAAALVNTKDVAGFETDFSELKGDVAVAQNQPDVARAAYQEAIKQLPAHSSYGSVLNMKLENLGQERKS